jgi:glucose/arabinose dehydrogenase
MLLLPVMALAFLACDGAAVPDPTPSPPTPPGDIFTAADGTRFRVEIVARNLEIPWGMTFAPDGRLFVTERPGRVRVVQAGTLLEQPALTLADVWAQGEAGLLGITLHPDFAQNRLVYLAYTAAVPGRPPVKRVVRYREVNNSLGEPAVILDDIPAAPIHDGGRIRFGPDRLLYITTGDAAVPDLSQDLASLNGKILRIQDDGRTPQDNPFSSPVFAYGLRNPQGLDWHPQTGDLWATDHGAVGNDELNLIQAGRNYGWPVIEGQQTRPGMETPVLLFTPAIAPSGASFYTGAAMPNFRHNLFFTALRGQHIHRVRFDLANPRQVAASERMLENRFGRIRDVVTGPDGALYFCTSNRDGRGSPVDDDDRIVRIVPAS